MPNDGSKSKRNLSVPNFLRRKSSATKLQDTKTLLDSNPDLIGDDKGDFYDDYDEIKRDAAAAGNPVKGMFSKKHAEAQREISSRVDGLAQRVQQRSDELDLEAQQRWKPHGAQDPPAGGVRTSYDSSGRSIIPHFATPRDSFQSSGHSSGAGHSAASVESQAYDAHFQQLQTTTAPSMTQPYRRAPTYPTASTTSLVAPSQHSSGSGHSDRSANRYARSDPSRNPVASPTFGQPAQSSQPGSSTQSQGRYYVGQQLSTFYQTSTQANRRVPVIWPTGEFLTDVYIDSRGKLACAGEVVAGRSAWYEVTYVPAAA